MSSHNKALGCRPRSYGDRLSEEALPTTVRENKKLVKSLRDELNRYVTPDALESALREAYSGDRMSARQVGPKLVQLNQLIREAGTFATQLADALPGDSAERARAFERWRASLEAMASNPRVLATLIVEGTPGPKRERPLYSMCSAVARHFRRHGLKVKKSDPGLLADTLNEMLRVVKGRKGQGVADIRPYLYHAVEASKESSPLY